MQGRITEQHLADAEACFPGIAELYGALSSKPLTFLQLVWIYEGLIAASPRPRRPRRRSRRRD